jgi:hypothetical protein
LAALNLSKYFFVPLLLHLYFIEVYKQRRRGRGGQEPNYTAPLKPVSIPV